MDNTTQPINVENESQSTQSMQPIVDKPVKKKGHLGLILFHLVALPIIIGSSAGAMYVWQGDLAAKELKVQKDLVIAANKKLATEVAKTAGLLGTPTNCLVPATDCVAVAPTASVIENIKASITSGNTQALEGYMAASVNTILDATEAYGPQTPTQSVASITTFIGSPVTTTWNMEVAPSMYSGGDSGQYFPTTAIVGKSNDNKVISFSFDCNGKIDTVFMSITII